MAVSPFTYPVTRPVPLKFLPILIFFGLIIVVFAVIFNFIAGGYDDQSTTDPTFSKNITFWYNRFIPHGGPFIKDAWICKPAKVRYGDSIAFLDVEWSNRSTDHNVELSVQLSVSEYSQSGSEFRDGIPK